MYRLVPLALLALLSACSMQAVKAPALQDSVSSNTALIEAQQELLSLQNDQLEQMSANQENMANMLVAVQEQLVNMQQQATRTEVRVEKPRKVVKPVAVPLDGKIVVGRSEWVWLELFDRHVEARIDTGSRSSTLNVLNIQPFERNGEAWVRFNLSADEEDAWEAPLQRHIRIRNGSGEDLERRPVIKMAVRLGNTTEETELTLTSKEGLTYSLALGRDYLRDIAVVDVARKHVQPKIDEQTVSR